MIDYRDMGRLLYFVASVLAISAILVLAWVAFGIVGGIFVWGARVGHAAMRALTGF